ncbi:alcohol dehydrogenase catalytic domain-containing protein [Streptomyces sp. Rer75]|uniref:alcohol dehydrogenase catalytic domain-containing protein n=1 Tax=Streptomyces sp. Rer75 TaxID=2750011 RepID=UPI0027B8C4A5|nr:alcohol dehydrogenase catalytic domain-containing protein [Streptomyces sp. Rer75]
MPDAYGFTRYGGPETQAFLDLPKPVPGPGELLVAVYAAGVNPVDWKVRAGMHRGFLHLDLPAVLGREVAGAVEEVGEGVTGFSVGDPVFGSSAAGCGGYAPFAVLTADRTAPKPAGVSFTDAAALPIAAGTGYDAVGVLGGVRTVASDQPAASGACDRKAEGRPRSGPTRVIPTTQRACVPGVAGPTGLCGHPLGVLSGDVGDGRLAVSGA